MNRGDTAPDIVLKDQGGNEIRLSEAAAGGGLVVFFYPKDGTPVCAKEACAFRDNYGEFLKYNVKVVGVSSDDSTSHKRFAQEHNLAFPLLWDEGGRLRKLWKVPGTLGVLPGRLPMSWMREWWCKASSPPSSKLASTSPPPSRRCGRWTP